MLSGVDLSVARAIFHTSEQGLVSNEFWVQQPSVDGLGPVLEGVKRRAIEQRVRQWGAGQRLERPLQPSSDSTDLAELLQLSGWQHATALPPHPGGADVAGGADGNSHSSKLLLRNRPQGLKPADSWTGRTLCSGLPASLLLLATLSRALCSD